MTWEEHWQDANVPWDAGAPEPALVAWIEAQRGEVDATETHARQRVLVPGCGAGYSAAALAGLPGAEVIGLDIAPSSRDRFHEVAREAGVADRVTHRVGDFFTEDLGARFDLIYDYTFLCALPRERRADWASRMAQLVGPGGTLLAIVFPIMDAPADYEGPPWPLTPGLVRELVQAHFDVVEDRPIEASHPGREGKESWLRLRRRESP